MSYVTDPVIHQLRSERMGRGLSQREVGELIGNTSYGSIYNWECGVNSPTLQNLRIWAEALGYEVVLQRRGVS